jgi:uncharacterized protein (DUF1697 family)
MEQTVHAANTPFALRAARSCSLYAAHHVAPPGPVVAPWVLWRMGRSGSTSGTFVALLRGINVGGKHTLPMKDLVAIFERAGCGDVRHYIQSGNVVFTAAPDLGKRVPELVASSIERKFAMKVPVLVRTAAEIRAVAETNPLLAEGASPESLHVLFLADTPAKKNGAALDPQRSPPDTFVLRGREVYLSCPNGVGRTKLTNSYFDTTLATTSTGRNWRTVLRLVEMAHG